MKSDEWKRDPKVCKIPAKWKNHCVENYECFRVLDGVLDVISFKEGDTKFEPKYHFPVPIGVLFLWEEIEAPFLVATHPNGHTEVRKCR